MKKTFLATLAAAALAISSFGAHAQKDPTVGGAEMYPTKTIVENAVNSPIHKTLVAAVKAGGLVDTLNSTGPFTVFAPTDDAFAKLPRGHRRNTRQAGKQKDPRQYPHLSRRSRQDQLQRACEA